MKSDAHNTDPGREAPRRSPLRRVAALTLGTLAILLVGASAAMAAPRLDMEVSVPAEAEPGAFLQIGALVQNRGDEATSGPLQLKITLPSGLEPEIPSYFCTDFTASVVSCETEVIPPAGQSNLGVGIDVAPGATPGFETIGFEAIAPGAQPVSASYPIAIRPSSGDFGVFDVDGAFETATGGDFTQAGGHPSVLSVEARLNTRTNPDGQTIPASSLEELAIEFPPGFVGDPSATTKCTEAELAKLGDIFTSSCPTDSQIGTVEIGVGALGGRMRVGLFNMEAPKNVPARFGFNLLGNVVHADAEIRSGSDYGITARTRGLQQVMTIYGMKVNLWGVPADPVHGDRREICGVNHLIAWPGFGCPVESSLDPAPFVSLPTMCTEPGQGLDTRVTAVSWDGQSGAAGFESHDSGGDPQGTDGCEKVPFSPNLSIQPDSATAASPSGVHVELSVPQNQNPTGVTSGHLRDAVITLPTGVRVNPTSADGTVGCGSAQVQLHSSGPASCPAAAKIGTVRIETPVLDEELTGGVYLAAQNDNPFNSLLAMYVVAEGPGLVVKLPGKIDLDPSTGRVVVSFDDNPQLPFSHLSMDLAGGERAPLANPDACGAYTTEYTLTSWSGKTVNGTSSYEIDQGCETGGFAPGFAAGSTNPLAGEHSPFTFRVTRADGQQNLSTIGTRLPEGLLAKLAGVPLCGEAQAASGECPNASRVGSAAVGLGAGTNPLYVPQAGKAPTAVYLAGPYKGAPYSLVVKVPAQAGPFDLGTVVVRNALRVDPLTTQVSAESDPLPQILQGIPIGYRDVRVAIDRPDFTLNPTGCNQQAVTASLTSVAGQTVSPESRYQVAGCGELGFKPKLGLRLSGQMNRSGNPALRAVLTQPASSRANIAKTQVVLPESMFIDNAHISNPCTRVQFEADQCPKGSILGAATAYTPLLDEPLTGPVYFRSNGGERELPDLVADLDGLIDVTLVGFIDSVKVKNSETSRVRTRFQSVPDAPVSKFVLRLHGGKRGLIENSVNLCHSARKATVKTQGQNGKAHDFTRKIGTNCGSKG